MSDKPIRIQRRRTKGWKMPPNTVCVTRPGPFGNPFTCITFEGDNLVFDPVQNVVLFRNWLKNDPIGMQMAARAREELRGKNLACFCPLDKPCHADVLLEIANG